PVERAPRAPRAPRRARAAAEDDAAQPTDDAAALPGFLTRPIAAEEAASAEDEPAPAPQRRTRREAEAAATAEEAGDPLNPQGLRLQTNTTFRRHPPALGGRLMELLVFVVALCLATGVAGVRLSFRAHRRIGAVQRLHDGQLEGARRRVAQLEAALT